MWRAPSWKMKEPLGSGNSLLHRQTKTEQKGGCLDKLPPAELYLGEHLVCSRITCCFQGGWFGRWHLTSFPCELHIWGITKQTAQRKAAHQTGCMESHSLVVPLKLRDGKCMSRERRWQLQRPQETKVFVSCISATESEWGEHCFFLYEI